MANTFEDQAQERFGKAKAFLSKAQTLLQDDLVARTVLADAVSAIKNALQGFLLVRVSQSPSHPESQHWQEVAASNRMPDLIGTCIDAGLDIRQFARDIRRLNDERNYRTHDDPHRRIDAEQAQRALELARNVAQRVNAAVRGQRAVEIPAPLARTTSTRVPLHNSAGAGYASAGRQGPVAVSAATHEPPVPASVPTATGARSATSTPGIGTASAPAAEEPATAASEDDETPAAEDTGVFATITGARRGMGSRLARGAIAAAAAAGGIAAGLVLAIPIAHGSAPGPLSSAQSWYATTRTLVVTRPAATPALVPSATSESAGDLTVSALVCQAGKAIFRLQNAGRTPLPWAAGAPETGESVTFAVAPASVPQSSALGTLIPGGSATITVSSTTADPYPILILAPGGTISLVAPAC